MPRPTAPLRLVSTAFALSLALGLAASACSLIVDRNTEVCRTTSDCRAKGGDFVGSICQSSACVFACTKNAECLDSGNLDVCVDHRCRAVLAHGCYAVSLGQETATVPAPVVSAEIRATFASDAELVLFGALLPNDGQKGTERWNGVRTALDDWTRTDGLRAVGNRKLAFVACPDTTEAATHLLSLGVSAMVGGNGSGTTLKIANEVTIAGGALLFAPSATSRDITNLSSPLVWRSAPSDEVQADALLALLRPLTPANKTQINVAMIFVNDTYGASLSALVAGRKPPNVNTSSFFYETSKNDAGDTTVTFPIDKVEAFHPDVVVTVGSTEVVDGVYVPLTTALRATPPYILLSDGAKGDLLAQRVANDNFWRPRVRVTAPKEPPLDHTAYDEFRANYQRVTAALPKAYGVAGAYDATYLLALAAAGTPTGTRPTGEGLAALLRNVSDKSATRLPAIAGSIPAAGAALAAGRTIDFVGASGELDFIPGKAVGEANAPISVYCVNSAASDDQGAFREVTYFESGKGLASTTVDCP